MNEYRTVRVKNKKGCKFLGELEKQGWKFDHIKRYVCDNGKTDRGKESNAFIDYVLVREVPEQTEGES